MIEDDLLQVISLLAGSRRASATCSPRSFTVSLYDVWESKGRAALEQLSKRTRGFIRLVRSESCLEVRRPRSWLGRALRRPEIPTVEVGLVGVAETEDEGSLRVGHAEFNVWRDVNYLVLFLSVLEKVCRGTLR